MLRTMIGKVRKQSASAGYVPPESRHIICAIPNVFPKNSARSRNRAHPTPPRQALPPTAGTMQRAWQAKWHRLPVCGDHRDPAIVAICVKRAANPKGRHPAYDPAPERHKSPPPSRQTPTPTRKTAPRTTKCMPPNPPAKTRTMAENQTGIEGHRWCAPHSPIPQQLPCRAVEGRHSSPRMRQSPIKEANNRCSGHFPHFERLRERGLSGRWGAGTTWRTFFTRDAGRPVYCTKSQTSKL